MKLTTKSAYGLTTPVYYRKGDGEESSDEQALAEVLEKRAYRRIRSGFDVLPGERWLDLGANIGAFALYCRMQGATAVCYEPDPYCFEILRKNAPGFTCVNAAVTAFHDATLTFRTSNNPDNRYRGTVMRGNVHVPGRYVECPPVKNIHAGKLMKEHFDGVKCDIEGSEGPLIDSWLFPRCKKLVMEYHHSRNSDVRSLKRRLQILKKRFAVVKYPSVYERVIEGADWPRYDQLIFCTEPRG